MVILKANENANVSASKNLTFKSKMEVLVFKTSVSNRSHVEKVEAVLNDTPAIARWNFDLEDCDHILRIVTDSILPHQIESILSTHGFYCQELK